MVARMKFHILVSVKWCLVVIVLVGTFQIAYSKKKSRKNDEDDSIVAKYLKKLQDNSDNSDTSDESDDPNSGEKISKKKIKNGKKTYHITTIVKNKVHNRKPEKKYKAGTVIEKTKTITILKSKVKKQLKDNQTHTNDEENQDENKTDLIFTKNRNKLEENPKYRRTKVGKEFHNRRKPYDRRIKIPKLDLLSTSTPAPVFTLYPPKPYMTLTLKVVVHYDSILRTRLYSNRSRLLVKLDTMVLLKEVRNVFASNDLRINIIFNLLDVKFLKSSNTVPLDEFSIKYLESYCKWQGKFKAKEHYYSILLTGLDVVHYDANGKKSKKNTARSYKNGHCSMRNSCMASEWRDNRKLLAFLIAHELAHSLGVNHDGPPYNECAKSGFVMGSSFDTYNPPRTWSLCSGKDLRDYLASKKAWCLPRLTYNII